MPKVICTKKDWLRLGLLLFADRGPTALNIEKMALELGCAKTSFYNYFKNRNIFIDQIIEYWVTYTTVQTREALDKIETPIEKIKFITKYLYSTKEMKNFYFYFRQLGEKDLKYRYILNKNESYRIHSFSNILRDLNLHEQEAKIKAEIYYDYFFGWYERNKHISITPKILKQQFKVISMIIGIDISS